MTGCEMIHCTKFQDGKCAEEREYTDPATGNACCSRGEGAIPMQPAPDLPALVARCRPWIEYEIGYINYICEGTTDEGGMQDAWRRKRELDALLSDIAKAGV